MKALLIIVVAIFLLLCGYVGYGGWLCRQWGVDPKRKTPAHEKQDGVDYLAAEPAVLMGHHFSSIAGAGPINGPIQAAIFGWVPVFLWCIIGGIFFGGLQDFGSMFASVRNDGKTIGEIIRSSMGRRAQKLFTIFCLLVLILVIASFVNVVAGTFYTDFSQGGSFGFNTTPTGNQTTAIISVLFILLAVCYGLLTNRFGMGTLPATVLGIAGVVVLVVLGLNVGFAMGRTPWILFIAGYLVVASLLPVWILLQPRDYLSSFLLYAMIALALLGIVVSALTGNTSFSIPAFTGFKTASGAYMFPTLFITVACGACSGFHSLIASGTSSKQLDSETHMLPISYGSMLVESALGIVAMLAVGMVFDRFTSGEFGSPTVAFAKGISLMFAEEGTSLNNTIAALLTLAVSVFALTSLDTATRLSRLLFAEMLLKDGEKDYHDATGIRKLFCHPVFGTVFMVTIGSVLGFLSLSQIWGLFGAANQLLAGIALMAVAEWLGNAGKNNKMFYIPMIFMLTVTISSLVLTIKGKIMLIAGAVPEKVANWGDWFQMLFALAMVVLAMILVVEAIGVFKRQLSRKTA